MTAEQRLRAIELMLVTVDSRRPDESSAPQPYEVTESELRDVLRMARGEGPRTAVGRLARNVALSETLEPAGTR